MRRRRENDTFFFFTKLKQWFGVRWVLTAQSAPEGRCAPGAPGADGGCPSKHPACQDWQSHPPVSTHSVGMSYPRGNNPFGSGRPPIFPAHPPASQQFPQPASTCLPIPACPGALAEPPALPWGSQVLVAAVPLIPAEPPCSLFSLVSTAHISMIDCVWV